MKRNDDFRKFVEAARNAPEKKPGEGGPKPASAGGVKKKSQGSKKFKQLMEQKAKEKEEGDAGQYRDRADERRKDKNEDPENEVAALASVDIEMSKYLGGDLEHTHLVKGLDFALLNKVRGELEHKTLLGGLGALGGAGGGGGRHAASLKTTKFSAGGLKRGGLSAAAAGSAGTHLAQALDGGRGGSRSGAVATVATHTHMGKALAYYLARDGREAADADARRRQAAGGLRGSQRTAQHGNVDRMGFEFNLGADKLDVAAELPTTVSRAKVKLGEDWVHDEDDELVLSAMGEDGTSPDLADLQARCVAALQAHRSGKKLKHATAASALKVATVSAGAATGAFAVPAPAAAAQEDDIFAGAGAYNADVAAEQAAPKRSRWDAAAAPAFLAAAAAGGESYFADLRATGWVPGDDTGGPALGQQQQPPAAGDLTHIMAGIKGLAKAADRAEARKEGRVAAPAAKAATDMSTGYKGTGYGEDHDYDYGGEE
jgi:hypothetical protein